ncbi:uncharacterized protein EV420DRAFT_1339948 [Desarmillaria tabescens]|uniref:Heterokaryon incompatibility domain-containing protein n=1 Tax=Armillaria tabescens TaxID=1929756 RepID=A0AA39JRL3_ARMTA|nr:uncharacterized protein EV420DRAFT_1339948 [Desarmillaria tabescens]KAK0445303.1 hypothetical protein EV420DRAFT_1339948 [Desarmillaria tabescens]
MDMEGKSDESNVLLEAYWKHRIRSRGFIRYKKYNPPEITLSALTEAGQDESTIPVLKQRSYTGKKVIPSALADTPCADLGVHGIFEKLNTILGTSHILSPMMTTVLDSYIEQGYDFGTVYAHLRFCWYHPDTIEKLRRHEENDQELRRKAIVDNKISNRNLPPRRLWDLYANQVVPYWVALTDWRAMSHAWMSDDERVNMMTPINGYEWPVPMPKDANLNLVRIEMLNCGAECAWLDVLCLRQEQNIREDHHEEDQRKEEWKLDVPTIGHVYDGLWRKVVCFLNGLGRPLNFKLGDLESNRCWFKRAWTLQEVPDVCDPLTVGGDTGDAEEEMLTRVHEQLELLRDMRRSGTPFTILSEMRNRVSTKPLDKVAGLIYLLDAKSIPIYDGAQSDEDAWEALVDTTSPSLRAELFFCFPRPGNKKKCWHPSWEQVMAHTLPWGNGGHGRNIGCVFRTEEIDSDWYEGPRVDSVYISGLAETSDSPRHGKLFVKADFLWWDGEYKIVADHTYPIRDGWYTLIATGGGYVPPIADFWVVGRLRDDGKFGKVSVIRFERPGRPQQRFGFYKCVKTVLC